MAEHVWTVLCYRGSVDKDVGNVSLLHVIEELRFAEEEGVILESMQQADARAVGIDMQLVSWWVRTDFTQPEQAQARITLLMPNGKEMESAQLPVNLTESTGFRWKMHLPALPFVGFGLYWFVVEKLEGKHWRAMTRIPLHAKRGEDPYASGKQLVVKPKKDSEKEQRRKTARRGPKGVESTE